ncbi:hypothetical protein [Bifidobacterium tsurumiense]
MRSSRRRFGALLAVLAVVFGLASCGGPDFSSFTDALKFGDQDVSDTQVVDRMVIPDGGLGDLVGADQVAWMTKGQGADWTLSEGAARQIMKDQPSYQCMALSHTRQAESPDEGPWSLASLDGGGQACQKTRRLSWLEKSLWSMYRKQSDSTIEWLSTDRNTLEASERGVDVLRRNASPAYSSWFGAVQPYLNVSQGVLVVFAAVSLIALAVRMVWNIRDADADSHLLGRFGWILLGCFLGSSCASIALTFLTTSTTAEDGTVTPALQSWTPGGGTSFYVSDWIRMQVDPFMLVAAVVGVMAAGFKLVTAQEGRDLVPLGKSLAWAIATAVLLAGGVNTFSNVVDTWTSGVLEAASGMMKDAWESNSLAASQFFELDAPIALLLTIIVWIGGTVSKIFTYLRAGLLPVLVGIAPMWAAMSWTELGKQAFAKTMGWLLAFLAYKPVAALMLAAGSAIMASGGGDSEIITLVLTLVVIIALPALVKTIVPAVQMSVGGGGGVMPSVLGMGAGAVVAGAAHGVAAAGGGIAGLFRRAGGSGASDAPKGASPGAGGSGHASAIHGTDAPVEGRGGAGSGPGTGSRTGTDGTTSAGAVPSGVRGPSSAPDGVGRASGEVASGGAPDGANRATVRRGRHEGKVF